MIRHIVLIRSAPAVAEAEWESVFAGLAALSDVVPGIRSFAAGPDNSPEGRARGYTHAFTFDFDDAAARDAYLVHPAHRAAAVKLRAATEGGGDGLLILDFLAPG